MVSQSLLQFPIQYEGFMFSNMWIWIICFGTFISFLLRLVISYWIYKDAKKRGEKEVLWLIVGLVGGLVGLIIWLLVRPDISQTPGRKMRSQSPNRAPRPQRYQRSSPGKPCPDCDRAMRWIDEHGEWFCDSCREYK